MPQSLVLYQSKYGATKQYAHMLQEALSCDILEITHYATTICENYDQLIFAGGIYAGGIAGIHTLRKHYPKLQHKKIAILCVGASPQDPKAIGELKKSNLKDDLKDIPLFYARGAWNESIMTFKDRTLCKLLKKMITKQDPASYEPWMKALLSAQGQVCDWTDKKYLIPLLEYIQKE